MKNEFLWTLVLCVAVTGTWSCLERSMKSDRTGKRVMFLLIATICAVMLIECIRQLTDPDVPRVSVPLRFVEKALAFLGVAMAIISLFPKKAEVIFIPKMVGLTPDEVELLLQKVKKEFNLKDDLMNDIAFWSGPQSKFTGTVMEIGSSFLRCYAYKNEAHIFLEQHPKGKILLK